jgi:recombination protein RecT
MVHKNDRFRFWIDGEGEHIDHEPLMFGDRGEVIGVYALAKTKDGGLYVEVMDKAQVMAVKGASRAKTGPWTGPFEHEMWRKTAIRRLSKRLPMNTDLEAVIKRDDEMYDLEKPKDEVQQDFTKPRKLSKLIKEATPEAVVVAEEPAPTAEEI